VLSTNSSRCDNASIVLVQLSNASSPLEVEGALQYQYYNTSAFSTESVFATDVLMSGGQSVCYSLDPSCFLYDNTLATVTQT
jgi:hypothetical protein